MARKRDNVADNVVFDKVPLLPDAVAMTAKEEEELRAAAVEMKRRLTAKCSPIDQCAVCLERLTVGGTALPPCGHTLCVRCANELPETEANLASSVQLMTTSGKRSVPTSSEVSSGSEISPGRAMLLAVRGQASPSRPAIALEMMTRPSVGHLNALLRESSATVAQNRTLAALAASVHTNTHTCPTCNASFTANKGASWPRNVFLEESLAPPSLCALCTNDGDDGDRATHMCSQCGPICPGHHLIHTSKTSLKAHVVESLARANEQIVCAVHGRPLEALCETCNVAVCTPCLISIHQRPAHNTVLIVEHANALRTRLAQARAASTMRTDELEAWLVAADKTTLALEKQLSALHVQIDNAFDDLAGLLAHRRQELHEQASNFVDAEKRELAGDVAAAEQRWLALQGGAHLATQLEAETTTVTTLAALGPRTETHLTNISLAPCDPSPSVRSASLQLSADTRLQLGSIGSLAFGHTSRGRSARPRVAVSKQVATRSFATDAL